MIGPKLLNPERTAFGKSQMLAIRRWPAGLTSMSQKLVENGNNNGDDGRNEHIVAGCFLSLPPITLVE